MKDPVENVRKGEGVLENKNLEGDWMNVKNGPVEALCWLKLNLLPSSPFPLKEADWFSRILTELPVLIRRFFDVDLSNGRPEMLRAKLRASLRRLGYMTDGQDAVT